ncbi:hypothetical protein Fot_19446 [Forsythia ovata]|uniref:Uncharacterized protein n=1 Tax=Forsythia ovata TaxID=205694 RepID=A0ABD1VNV1_9LAMI
MCDNKGHVVDRDDDLSLEQIGGQGLNDPVDYIAMVRYEPLPKKRGVDDEDNEYIEKVAYERVTVEKDDLEQQAVAHKTVEKQHVQKEGDVKQDGKKQSVVSLIATQP